jgi:hypothetical protein
MAFVPKHFIAFSGQGRFNLKHEAPPAQAHIEIGATGAETGVARRSDGTEEVPGDCRIGQATRKLQN